MTPLDKPFRADVGTHKLRVLKSGFEPIEKDVSTLAQQAQTVKLDLVKENKTGHLTVREESGKEVHVFVDDDVGPAPWSGDLAPGPHVIEVKGEGIGAPKRTIDLAAKGNLEVAIDATPLMGHLRIQTLNKLGEIFLDGKKVGEQPGEWEGDLPPGTYEASVVAAGYGRTSTSSASLRAQTAGFEAGTLVAKPVRRRRPRRRPSAWFKGLYAKFNLMAALPCRGSADIEKNCGGGSVGSCSSGGFDGSVGPKLHVGYSWDFLSVELVGAFLVDLPHNVDRIVHQQRRRHAQQDDRLPTTTWRASRRKSSTASPPSSGRVGASPARTTRCASPSAWRSAARTPPATSESLNDKWSPRHRRQHRLGRCSTRGSSSAARRAPSSPSA